MLHLLHLLHLRVQCVCHPDRDPLLENNPWRFLWTGIAWGLLGLGFLLPALAS